jgi:sulfoxide reductase heme-binding subunit YedZ
VGAQLIAPAILIDRTGRKKLRLYVKYTMPTLNALNRFYKPLLFLVCLLPFADLMRRAFEIGGGSLGANPIEELLHELGLWSLRFIFITLLVTPLKDLVGKPWPLAFRRMLGLFAFFYVTMHFLTWLWLDQEFYWSGILVDIGKRPFITIGFLAFVLLIPMAITSTNGWIRRLGAQRWRNLHRLIYVIVLLGVWHFYWLVKSDVREPLIYLAIAAALLGWRAWKARAKLRATT